MHHFAMCLPTCSPHLYKFRCFCGGLRLPLLDRSRFYELPKWRRHRQICPRCWVCLGCCRRSGLESLGLQRLVEGMQVPLGRAIGHTDFMKDVWMFVALSWHNMCWFSWKRRQQIYIYIFKLDTSTAVEAIPSRNHDFLYWKWKTRWWMSIHGLLGLDCLFRFSVPQEVILLPLEKGTCQRKQQVLTIPGLAATMKPTFNIFEPYEAVAVEYYVILDFSMFTNFVVQLFFRTILIYVSIQSGKW